jgi:hypothetical protein
MTTCPSQDYLSRSTLPVDYLSKSRLLVRGHCVRGKATCQWLLVLVMAAVNDYLSVAVNDCLSAAVNDHLSKPKHYYQWQHLQYGEALVRGHGTVGA